MPYPTYSKYHNKICEFDGKKFDSKKELDRYLELILMIRSGDIKYLELQPRFRIEINGKKICDYYADFRYFDTKKNRYVVEDVKGMKTDVYKIKKKLVEAQLGINVEEIN